MTWRPSKSPRECSGINRRDTVSCFVIHKYGNGKQRLLVAAEPCASFQLIQSRRVHTKERRTQNPVSVYLSIPASDEDVLIPLLRIMMTQFLKVNTRHLYQDNRGAQEI